MKWWIRALLATVVLNVFLVGLWFYLDMELGRQVVDKADLASRMEQIGATCGQIAGFGTAMVWFLAFAFRKKKN